MPQCLGSTNRQHAQATGLHCLCCGVANHAILGPALQLVPTMRRQLHLPQPGLPSCTCTPVLRHLVHCYHHNHSLEYSEVPTCSSGTSTNWRLTRSAVQKSSSSTVSRARSQILPSQSTLARHFLGLPGRRTWMVVWFETWQQGSHVTVAARCTGQGHGTARYTPGKLSSPHAGRAAAWDLSAWQLACCMSRQCWTTLLRTKVPARTTSLKAQWQLGHHLWRAISCRLNTGTLPAVLAASANSAAGSPRVHWS